MRKSLLLNCLLDGEVYELTAGFLSDIFLRSLGRGFPRKDC